jgi:hypothetical protein
LQFHLALALGVTVEQLLTGMPAPLSQQELTEWMIYKRLYPFGPDVEDLRFGVSSALFVNAHRDPNKPAAKTEEFMFGKRREKTTAEQAAEWKAYARAIGGKVIIGGKNGSTKHNR